MSIKGGIFPTDKGTGEEKILKLRQGLGFHCDPPEFAKSPMLYEVHLLWYCRQNQIAVNSLAETTPLTYNWLW